MVIDARETQVLERPSPQRLDQTIARSGRIHLAARDLFEQILKLFV